MNSFLRDLRLGVRTALRSPGYSLVAVVTMALAIGANTLLFGLASPLVIRPLPIENPDSLGWIRQTNGPRGISMGRSSMPDFLDWRESARSFSSLAGRESATGTLLGTGDARTISVMGTLAPGVAIGSANTEMRELAARLAKAHPTTNTDWELTVLDTRTAITSADTWVVLAVWIPASRAMKVDPVTALRAD